MREVFLPASKLVCRIINTHYDIIIISTIIYITCEGWLKDFKLYYAEKY